MRNRVGERVGRDLRRRRDRNGSGIQPEPFCAESGPRAQGIHNWSVHMRDSFGTGCLHGGFTSCLLTSHQFADNDIRFKAAPAGSRQANRARVLGESSARAGEAEKQDDDTDSQISWHS